MFYDFRTDIAVPVGSGSWPEQNLSRRFLSFVPSSGRLAPFDSGQTVLDYTGLDQIEFVRTVLGYIVQSFDFVQIAEK